MSLRTPVPSALLAELGGLSSDACQGFSWMGGEGKKSIILMKTFWFSLECEPSTLTLFMELSAINLLGRVAGFSQLQVLF